MSAQQQWEAEGTAVYFGDGGIELRRCRDGRARAQLIAAAPDLLAALLRFQNDAFDFGMPFDHPCRVLARAAIAKAEGDRP